MARENAGTVALKLLVAKLEKDVYMAQNALSAKVAEASLLRDELRASQQQVTKLLGIFERIVSHLEYVAKLAGEAGQRRPT